ncbi:hypothetical protein [Pseudonocardia sp. NPDC049635]|uniref:hypothetical protein n=1 Tax=Pseudonocardia sp. NPDC049635 TaxID=3155506 RepID=UPI0033C91FE0
MEPPAPRHDARSVALHYTSKIASHLFANRVPPPEIEVRTDFAPMFAPNERIWVQGPYTLEEFSATGDGTYETRHTIVGGTGLLGMTMLAATLGASAAGNKRRRQQAAAAMVPHWHVVDQGTIFVSYLGMYMQSTNGFFTWPWGAIPQGDLPQPEVFAFTGMTPNGSVQLAVNSVWAELVFVAWALARHRRHPRLHDGSWWPDGWHGNPPDLKALGG